MNGRKLPSGALILTETIAGMALICRHEAVRGIWGSKVFEFDPLDRWYVKFLCLQNPKFHCRNERKPIFSSVLTSC